MARKFIIRVLNTFPKNLNEHGLLQKNSKLIKGLMDNQLIS